MRCLILILLGSLVAELSGQEPVAPPDRFVKAAEYFWDADPGEGSGSALPVADGTFDEAIESLLGTGIPVPATAGPHTLSVRVQDHADTWSAPFATVVAIPDVSVVPAPARNIVAAEYFWNTDPGPGGGISLPAVDGVLNETVESLLGSAIPLPSGVGPHTLHVRVQDDEGTWSEPFATVVHIPDVSVVPAPVRNIVAAEYFWDIDPGQGGGMPLPVVDGAFDESVESLFDTSIGIPPGSGAHTLNVRVLDSEGVWSAAFATSVHVPDQPVARAPVIGIVEAEYFWDVDPGPGNGFSLGALDGMSGETTEAFLANNIVTPGSYGPHRFNLRVRDIDGTWSAPFITVVSVTLDPDNLQLSLDLDGDTLSTLMEYFLGTDPSIPDDPGQHIFNGLKPLPGGGSEEHFFFEFHRNYIASDVVLHVEVTPNLLDWFDTPEWVTETVNSNELLQFFATPDRQEEPRLFSRYWLEYTAQ